MKILIKNISFEYVDATMFNKVTFLDGKVKAEYMIINGLNKIDGEMLFDDDIWSMTIENITAKIAENLVECFDSVK